MPPDSTDGAPLVPTTPRLQLTMPVPKGALRSPADLTRAEEELQRTIGLPSGIAFIVGAIIGSGIFASPGSVLLYSGSVGASLLAWFVAGLIAITGAASYAELVRCSNSFVGQLILASGTMLPNSGGEYAYIIAAFGPLPAFLFVWTSGMVTRPGSLAIISLVCGEYIVKPFYDDPSSADSMYMSKMVAVLVVVVITLVNSFNVAWAIKLQDIFTVLKLIALALVCLLGLIFFIKDGSNEGTPAYENFHGFFDGTCAAHSPARLGMAVIASLWSYDGWNNLNFVTEELKDPDRNLPRALFIGVPTVIFSYFFATASYYAVLPLSSIVNFNTGTEIEGFATQFGTAALGVAGRIILPLCIAASTFGAANGTGFTGARLVLAAAREGHFPAWLGRLRPGKQPTPMAALCFQGLIAVFMLLPGNFETLVNYFSVCAWLFYLLGVGSLLWLRRTKPLMRRPFRVWLWVPIVFCLVSVALVISLIAMEPLESFIAAAFIFTGIPIYFFKERHRPRAVPMWPEN